MLQGHIKQWSFIEAQLLEPNVNLGMVSPVYVNLLRGRVSYLIDMYMYSMRYDSH